MVCKEDVVTWFKELTSHKRIDVMCTLLNMCLPFELRFLGTCLEDLGKRDFHDLRDAESRANNVSEFSELQCMSDKRTQRKLALYLALLHSCNHACSNGLFKILADFDFGEISNITNNTSDENPLDELLLIYTLALNHPAFTYEQRAEFGNILVKLQEEENKLYAARPSVGIGLVYVKNPLQACIPCPTSDDQGQLGPCTGISLPPSHHAGDLKGRGSLPPGLSLSPGLALTPDQVASYVHVTFPTVPQPVSAVPWPGSPLMMASLCGLPGEPESSPYPSSPLVSRQSSPSQSGSPSRAGSPARTVGVHVTGNDRHQSFKGQRRTDRTPCARANCIDGPAGQHSRGSLSRKGSSEPDSLRDTLGKEMPSYVHSLQNYSAEELRRMGDEELRELGLSPGAVQQLRALVGKLQGTNGLCLRASNDSSSRPEVSGGGPGRGVDMAAVRRRDEEASERRGAAGGRGRLEAAALGPGPAPGLLAPGQCFACLVPVSAAPARFAAPPPHPVAFCCAGHGMRSLRLDERPVPVAVGVGVGTAQQGHCGGAGASSSDSSAGPSPPDTPSAAAPWCAPLASAATERWSPAAPPPGALVHLDDPDKERRPLGEDKCVSDEYSPPSITTTTITSTSITSSTATTCSSNSSCSSAASINSGGSSSNNGGNGNGGSGSGSSSSSSSTASSSNNSGAMGGGATRSRPPGLARGKAAGGPPGVQTVARGRGPGVAPASERPGARRDAPSTSSAPALNGAPPPPPPSARLPPPPSAQQQQQQAQDDRGKMYFVQSDFGGCSNAPHSHSHSHAAHTQQQQQQQQQQSLTHSHAFSSAPPAPASAASGGGGGGGAPPAYSPHFLPAHFTPLRSSSALFPSFAPAGYMRPFPFSAPNGDLVYGFHPAAPQTPPPPPSAAAYVPAPMVAAFAPAVPPPKLSCYNCGSHSHHASDCKDPTMEEMTKPGQYRLDFSPYPKGPAGGEVSSSEK